MDNSEQSALEAAQENRAQVQAIHRPLKLWYNGTPAGAALKASGMGSFPTFWQDLADWPHFREVRKAYHANPEGAEVPTRAVAEASEPGEEDAKPAAEATAAASTAAPETDASAAAATAAGAPAKPDGATGAAPAAAKDDGSGTGGGNDDDDDDDDDDDIEAPPMLVSLSDAMPAQETSMLHADQYEQDDEAEAEEERRQAEEEERRRAAKEAAKLAARVQAAPGSGPGPIAPKAGGAEAQPPATKPSRGRGRWGTEVVAVAKRPAPQVLAGTREAESIAFAYKPLLDELAERRAARGEASSGSSGGAPPAQSSKRRKRRRRWQSSDDTSSLFGARVVPAVLAMMPRGLTGRQQRVFLLKVQKEELLMRSARVAEDAKARAEDPARSPSPPAQYDSNGMRTNSREQRMRAALNKRKLECDEWIAQLNPASCGARGPTFKRKVYIPYKRYPEHNFIGQIIGPRGATQQQLERETGCKISIRGRGSRKEGKARRDGAPHEDDDDEAHVMLLGPDLYAIEGAVKVIEKMLIPDTDDAIMEAHKNRQLIQLAKVNGTYKRDEMALIAMQQAAESGKAASENRADQIYHMLDVRPEQRSEEDRQYIELMATLGDKTAIALKAKDARAGFSAAAPGTAAAPSSSTSAGKPAAFVPKSGAASAPGATAMPAAAAGAMARPAVAPSASQPVLR
ncbi:hypothetical protein FNF27_02975 [Cafeteria roenbergensis]|uniref:Branchpoint-bridging protein n=2 Tax=Cafeteria roenbergensis TaxID=33653 RepID=A0A5A8ECK5_CAFRO|nr:hypothetical protein FNF27_02975 [Cafeteria roenbergensis]